METYAQANAVAPPTDLKAKILGQIEQTPQAEVPVKETAEEQKAETPVIPLQPETATNSRVRFGVRLLPQPSFYWPSERINITT